MYNNISSRVFAIYPHETGTKVSCCSAAGDTDDQYRTPFQRQNMAVQLAEHQFRRSIVYEPMIDCKVWFWELRLY